MGILSNPIPTADDIGKALGRTLTEAEVSFFRELSPVLSRIGERIGEMQERAGDQIEGFRSNVSGDLFKLLGVLSEIRVVDGLKIEGKFEVNFVREQPKKEENK